MTNSGFDTMYILAEHTIKRRTPFCCESLNSLFKPCFVCHLLEFVQKLSHLPDKAKGILIIDMLTVRFKALTPF